MKLGTLERGEHSSAPASDMPRVVIFGDSHVHAIQLAIKTREAAQMPVAIEARRLLKIKGGAEDGGAPSRATMLDAFKTLFRRQASGQAAPRTLGDTTFKEFTALARALGPDDMLVSAVGGNQHAVFSTIQHPEPFDFFFPEDAPTATENDVALVPFRPLFDQFAAGLRRGDGATLGALRKSTRARMVHLLAPPPKADSDFIQQHHDSQFAADGIATLGVSSPGLRLKFWQMQNRALADICADLSIETIAPPAAACDADGFLSREYYARDATHANAAYGELVLQQLEDCALRRASA